MTRHVDVWKQGAVRDSETSVGGSREVSRTRPGRTSLHVAFVAVLGALLMGPTVDRAEAGGRRVPLEALLLAQDGAQSPAEPPRPAASPRNDEPPRIAPMRRPDSKAEAEAAERKRKEELAALPAYKRWWFWALTAAVVGGTVVLATTVIDPAEKPARGCTPSAIACFGDGR